MARLSDIIRTGEAALHGGRDEAGEDASDREGSPSEEAQFRSLPRGQAPDPVRMKDFPILSQIYNEVGTVATVVDQINQISAFIQAFTAGEQPTLRHPSRPEPSAEKPPKSTPAEPSPPAAPPRREPPPEPRAPSEADVESLYDELHRFVSGVMDAAQAGRPFTIDEAFLLIARIVDLPGATDILYRRAIYTREEGDTHGFASAVVLHSVNVSIYALKIGEGLGYNRDQRIDLGVAALLHDVGMVTLPPDIFSKGQLSRQDIEILHEHPLRAYDILARLGESYRWVADVAAQEHEREDGSGYPRGLQADQIHQYAKIIGVADTYAGLTRSRPERRGLLPFEAVKEILQTHKSKFDSRIVRVLLSKLSAFPIGSLVKLNSGAIGTVVETDEAYPLRPSIRIVYDAQGRRVDDERVINLREFPILHIADAIYREDLEADPTASAPRHTR